MDRDTIRIVLLVAGVFVIASVYIWGRYKQKLLDILHRKDEFEDLGLDQNEKSPAPVQDDDDLFDSLSYKKGRKEPAVTEETFADDFDEEEFEAATNPKPATRAAKPEPEPQRAGALGAPFLIQVSVVAGRGRFFNGEDLRDALMDLDLIHGEMGIFHRFDGQFKQTLFSCASLVEPGTFPINDMESFECPGVVFFFQTAGIADPLTVYDDLVNTCQELAERLGGTTWDERRQPLSAEKIAHMRALLEDAMEQP
ncbi:cell division protein ZipA C-terminal FtsZ-binding domain-containing protein [Methylomagnum sp.]